MAKARKIDYRSFEEAREFARALQLKNKDAWTRFSKGELEVEGKPPKPKDIPSRVDKIYKGHGWSGFDDFLGTKKNKELQKIYKNFEHARAFARTLKLETEEDWQKYLSGELSGKVDLPSNIPTNPQELYKDKGWIGFHDWLSDRYQPTVITIKSFEDAREYSRRLNIKSIQEWEKFRNGDDETREKCPTDIPVWPPHAYRGQGWTSWSDWMGLKIAQKQII